ncbi:serine hydrolase [Pedobacter sp. HMWF019]|uniref:serine hydrolase n=1 Tax=Pedobacter sp. HMWF019 TaxID=2056856 RepID=UPI000D3D6CE1|nr:serine hydrolase [Pedobacter sp. HMWF019]PTT03046.1 serine hydrolase [Pedobacter sp. HMWF019]
MDFKKAILLFFLCITSLCEAQSRHGAIDTLIERSHKLGLFNGNLLVMDQGKEIYRKAIGYVDASGKTSLTDQYRFHIGSIAKEFNAVAIMMLKEKGELSIDDKVNKYLDDLPEWAGGITIRNLLQYSSGLPDLKWKMISDDGGAMSALKDTGKLDFEPGTQYAYNNSNTFLQRQIVARISGMSFADFVRKNMLRPLEMNASLVDPDDDVPLMAKSYTDALVQSPLVSSISGWTAVTLDDFYKWEQSLEHFMLISPASTKELLTPFAPNKQCGLGGGKMEDLKLLAHKHDGTAMQYQALLIADVKRGRTVILLTNNRQGSLYDINSAIQNILDGKPYLQPKKQLVAALQDRLDKASGPDLIGVYQELKSKYPDDYNFSDESALNTVGYTLLGKKRFDSAVAVFEYNTVLFPRSGNVFDSLAEAYLNQGDKAKSLINYKRALELDPSNVGASEKIKSLEDRK